jgi:adenylyl-sulfate kinase
MWESIDTEYRMRAALARTSCGARHTARGRAGTFSDVSERAARRAEAGPERPAPSGARAEDVSERAARQAEDRGFCLWFTGFSGAGKSTIAEIVAERLRARGRRVEVLDGDEVREHLSKGLGFSKEDRDTNIRRIGFVASLLARNGVVAITAAISPYRAVRDEVRGWVDEFVEVWVDTPLDACEERDVKGLYARARAGEVAAFTGVSDPYESPLHPEVRVRTEGATPDESAAAVLAHLESRGLA